MSEGKFTLSIYRGTKGNQYWEDFEFDRNQGMNIISVLMDIQRNPVTKEGKAVTPVAWEMACLEEVCGSCSMLINGKPRQACTALIEEIIKTSGSNVIKLAPMSKFPLIKDLVVERKVMFDNLKKVKSWVPVETLHSVEFGEKISPSKQEAMYTLSTCMTCGCCLEACPQFSDRSKFVGAQVIGQVKLKNLHPVGKALKADRLNEMMKEGGIADCGNAQNCVAFCPKQIPLTEAIAKIGRDTTSQAIKNAISVPEND